MISEHHRHSPPHPAEQAAPASSEMSSVTRHRPIGQVLRRRAWVVLLVLCLSMAGGYAYLKRAHPLYTSAARLYVQPAGPQIMGTSSATSSTSTPNYLNTQCELIRSKPTLALAMGSLDTAHMATFVGVAAPLTYLKETLQVEAGKKDDIITISFDAPTPEEAAQVVNAVVDAFRANASTKEQSSAGEVLKRLESEKERREREVDAKAKAIIEFRQHGGPVVLDGNRASALTASLQSLSEAYNSAKLTRIEAESRLGERHPIYLSALRREQQYKAAYDEQQEAVASAEARAADLIRLEAEMQRSARQIDLVDARINEVHANDNVGALNIQVTDAAVPDPIATHPRKARTLLVVGCTGLLLGLLAAFLVDMSDDRLRSVTEAGALRMPVLAVVPRMGRRNVVVSGRASRLEPGSAIAEAFRTLRAGVEFGPPAKTILITSPTVGDGKSTVSSNLAITLASSGYQVLLIDGDLRAPSQGKIWETPRCDGLVGVVEHGMDVMAAIVPTGVNRLSLLPAGEHPENPAALVDSDAFSNVLTKLRDAYDYIIIDSPPTLLATDARLLGAVCDETILVVRADKTSARAAIDARDGLLSFGAGLLGVVVNGGPQRRYGHRGNYGVGLSGPMRRHETLPINGRGEQLNGAQVNGQKSPELLESSSRDV